MIRLRIRSDDSPLPAVLRGNTKSKTSFPAVVQYYTSLGTCEVPLTPVIVCVCVIKWQRTLVSHLYCIWQGFFVQPRESTDCLEFHKLLSLKAWGKYFCARWLFLRKYIYTSPSSPSPPKTFIAILQITSSHPHLRNIIFPISSANYTLVTSKFPYRQNLQPFNRQHERSSIFPKERKPLPYTLSRRRTSKTGLRIICRLEGSVPSRRARRVPRKCSGH